MKLSVTVSGDLGVTLDPEVASVRDSALDADARRDPADPVWGSAQTVVVEALEVAPNVLDFLPADVALDVDTGYFVTFRNPLTNAGAHVLLATDLFATSVLQKALDAQAEIKASYIDSVRVGAGREVQLRLVPTVPGVFNSFCSIGVQNSVDGTPNLMTGHAGRGMVSTMTVSP
jgi:hypothetical protein